MSKKQKIRSSQGMMQHSVFDYGIKGMKPVKSVGGLDAIKFIPLGKAATKFLREHPHFAQNLFDKIGEFGILAVASSFENLADNPSMMTDANKEAPKRFAMVYSLDPDNALEWLTATRKANRSRGDLRLKIIEAIAKDPDRKVERIANELKVSPSAVKKVRRELVAAQGFHHKVTRRRKRVTS